MKTLRTLQTLSKIGKIISKIISIFFDFLSYPVSDRRNADKDERSGTYYMNINTII